jgi:hypothetical protein
LYLAFFGSTIFSVFSQGTQNTFVLNLHGFHDALVDVLHQHQQHTTVETKILILA